MLTRREARGTPPFTRPIVRKGWEEHPRAEVTQADGLGDAREGVMRSGVARVTVGRGLAGAQPVSGAPAGADAFRTRGLPHRGPIFIGEQI